MDGLQILVQAILDEHSLSGLQSQLNKLVGDANKIKLKFDFDANSVKSAESQLKELAKTASSIAASSSGTIIKDIAAMASKASTDAVPKVLSNKTKSNKSVKKAVTTDVFDADKLRDEGRRFIATTENIVEHVQNEFSSLGQVDVSLFKNAEDDVQSFSASVKEADGVIEKFNFTLARIKEKGHEFDGFVQVSSTLTDKNAGTELEKKANYLKSMRTQLERILERNVTGNQPLFENTNEYVELIKAYQKAYTDTIRIERQAGALSSKNRYDLSESLQKFNMEAKRLHDIAYSGQNSGREAFQDNKNNELTALETYLKRYQKALDFSKELSISADTLKTKLQEAFDPGALAVYKREFQDFKQKVSQTDIDRRGREKLLNFINRQNAEIANITSKTLFGQTRQLQSGTTQYDQFIDRLREVNTRVAEIRSDNTSLSEEHEREIISMVSGLKRYGKELQANAYLAKNLRARPFSDIQDEFRKELENEEKEWKASGAYVGEFEKKVQNLKNILNNATPETGLDPYIHELKTIRTEYDGFIADQKRAEKQVKFSNEQKLAQSEFDTLKEKWQSAGLLTDEIRKSAEEVQRVLSKPFDASSLDDYSTKLGLLKDQIKQLEISKSKEKFTLQKDKAQETLSAQLKEWQHSGVVDDKFMADADKLQQALNAVWDTDGLQKYALQFSALQKQFRQLKIESSHQDELERLNSLGKKAQDSLIVQAERWRADGLLDDNLESEINRLYSLLEKPIDAKGLKAYGNELAELRGKIKLVQTENKEKDFRFKVDSAQEKLTTMLKTLQSSGVLNGEIRQAANEAQAALNNAFETRSLTEYNAKLASIKEQVKRLSIDRADDLFLLRKINAQDVFNAKKQEWTRSKFVTEDFLNDVERLSNVLDNVWDTNALRQYAVQFSSLQTEFRRLSSENSYKTKEESFDLRLGSAKQKFDTLIASWKKSGIFNGEIEALANNVQTALNKAFETRSLDEYNAKLTEVTEKARRLMITQDTKHLEEMQKKSKLAFESLVSGWERSGLVDDEFRSEIEATRELLNKPFNVKSIREYSDSLAVLKARYQSLRDVKLEADQKTKLNTLDTNIKDVKARLENLKKIYSAFTNDKSMMRRWDNLYNSIRPDMSEKELTNLRAKVKLFEKDLENAGLRGRSLFDELKNNAAKMASWMILGNVISGITRGITGMYDAVVRLDSAMTELKRVTDESAGSYDAFLSRAAAKSVELGTSYADFVNSTADFARLGYTMSEAEKLAEVANIYSVVGDGVSNVDDATSSVISTMKAFGIEASDAMSIVDKFNNVGNKFAITSGGIGEAMKISASALNAAGNTIDESIALIVAANNVVQDPDQTGTAWKTVSMRLRGAKTELEEAGLETDNMAESTSKLREQIKALTNTDGLGGFDIMKDEKTFKSTYEIMLGISKVWKDMSDIDQAALLELIAGKRQSNVVAAAITNMGDAVKVLEASMNSEGAALEEHEKWMNSIGAKQKQFKAQYEALSNAFLSSGLVKFAFDSGTGILGFLTRLIELVGSLPALGGVLTGFLGKFQLFEIDPGKNWGGSGIGISTFAEKNKKIMDFDVSLLEDYSRMIKGIGNDLEGMQQKQMIWSDTIGRGSGDLQNMVHYTDDAVISARQYRDEMERSGISAELFGMKSKIAAVGVQILHTAMNMLIGLGVGAVISLAVSGITKLINAEKEAANRTINNGKSVVEESKNIYGLANSYIELSDVITSGIDSRDEFVATQEKLIASLGLEGDAIDNLIGKYGLLNAVEDKLNHYKMQAAAAARQTRENTIKSLGKVDGAIGRFGIEGEGTASALETLIKRGLIKASVQGQDIGEIDLPHAILKPEFGSSSFEDVVENYKYLNEAATEANRIFGAENPVVKALTNEFTRYKEAMQDSIKAIEDSNDIIAESALFNEQKSGLPKTLEEFEGFRDRIVRKIKSDQSFYDLGNSAEVSADHILSQREQLKGLYNEYKETEALSREIEAKISAITDSVFLPREKSGQTSLSEMYGPISREISEFQNELRGLSKEELNFVVDITASGSAKNIEEIRTALAGYNSEASFYQRNANDIQESLKSLWNSDDFKDTRKDIVDMAKSLSGISASNVEELAGKSAELSKILHKNGMDAQFLAKILESQAMGGPGFELATAEALGLNDALNGLSYAFDEVTAARARFEAGSSAIEYDDNFKSYANAYKTLNEQLEAGTTGSKAFWNAAEYLFGSDRLAEWGWADGIDQIVAKTKELQPVFGDAESAGAGFIDKLYQMSQAGQLASESGKQLIEISKEADGSFKFNFEDEDLDGLADKLNITKEALVSCFEALKMWGAVDFSDTERVLEQIENMGLSTNVGHTFQISEQFEPIKKEINQYNDLIDEANKLGIDLSRTIYGNIDTNNRNILEWTDQNIEQYKDALESWGQDIIELKGSYSTVFGGSGEYDGIEIAFSPMLQTENGAVLLSKGTVDKYIFGLLEKAGNDRSKEKLLELDAEGLEVDGRRIQGLLADVGETAKKTSEAMNFTGNTGAVAKALENVEAAAKEAGIPVEDLSDALKRVQSTEKAINLDQLIEQLQNLGKSGKEIDDITSALKNIEGVTLLSAADDVATLTANLQQLGLAAQNGVTITVDYQSLGLLMSQIGFTKEQAQGLIQKLGEADNVSLTNATGQAVDLETALSVIDKISFDKTGQSADELGGAIDNTKSETERLNSEMDALNSKSTANVQSAINAIGYAAQTSKSKLQDLGVAVDNLNNKRVTIPVTIQTSGSLPSGVKVQPFASGTDGAPGGLSLVGEEAPELIQSKDKAWLAGKNGPEIVDLKRGDRVYNADDTKKILDGAADKEPDSEIPAYYGGTINTSKYKNKTSAASTASTSASSSTPSKSKSDSGSTSDEKSEEGKTPWEQLLKDYQHKRNLELMTDKQYYDELNILVEKYAETREKYEDEYRSLLEDRFSLMRSLADDWFNDKEHKIYLLEENDAPAADRIKVLKEMMDEAHRLADEAREYGLDENSEYIQKLQKQYLDARNDIIKLNEEAIDKEDEGFQKRLDSLEREITALEDSAADPQKIIKKHEEIQRLLHEQADKYRDIGLASVSRKYSVIQSEIKNYNELITEAKKLGVDLSRTVYGNIDTNNQKILEWTDENLELYKEELQSWGEAIDDLKGSYSTVFASSAEYDGIKIAFSPILQTPQGAVLLSSNTVDQYIFDLIRKAGDDLSKENLLKLDAEGLDVEGRHIRNLLADIGETAEKTSAAMHFTGDTGAAADSLRAIEEAAKNAGISTELLAEALQRVKDAGGSIDEFLFLNEIGAASSELAEKLTKLIYDLKDKWADHNKDKKDAISALYKKEIESYKNAISLLDNQYKELENKHYLDKMTDNLKAQMAEQVKIQRKAHEEAERLRADGVEKNEAAIQECISTWWEAYDNIMAIKRRIVDNVLSEYDEFIERADSFDMWKNFNFTKVDYLRQKLSAINKLLADGMLTLKEYNELLQKIAVDIYNEQKDAITTIIQKTMDMIRKETEEKIDELEKTYDKEIDLLEKRTKEELKLLEKEHDAQMDSLDDQMDAFKKLIELKKEALKDRKEEADYQKEVAKRTKEIAEKQAKLTQLDRDTSAEANAEKQKLAEELAELQEELADYQAEYSYNAQVESLDKELDAYEETADKERDAYQKSYDERKQAFEDMLESQKQALEDQKKAEIETLRATIDNEEALYTAAIERINADWDKLYEDLIAYNHKYGDMIDGDNSITSAWRTAKAAVEEYGCRVEEALAKAQQAAYDLSNSVWTGDDTVPEEKKTETKEETKKEDKKSEANKIIDLMKGNSSAWHSADDTERKRLAALNENYATQLQQVTGQAIVKDTHAGTWHYGSANGPRVYHTGLEQGLVGGEPLKNDEVLAVLRQGEGVFTQEQLANTYQKLKYTIPGVIDSVVSKITSTLSGAAERIGSAVRNTDQSTKNENVSMENNFYMQDVTEENMKKFAGYYADYTIDKLTSATKRRGLKNGAGFSLLRG